MLGESDSSIDALGMPTHVAGVPPDALAVRDGCGATLCRWSAMASDDYEWWVDRLAHCLKWTPVLRIDHFRAFADYWAVPGDAETAMDGAWCRGRFGSL